MTATNPNNATPILLTNGSTVVVGEIRWRRGWVPAKNLLIDVLQDHSVQGFLRSIVDAVFDVSGDALTSDEATMGKQLLDWAKEKADINELLKILPEAVKKLVGNWDTLTEVLIRGCLERGEDNQFPELDFDELSYADVVRLRAAVMEHNNFGKIVDTEKNSLVDVFTQMMTVETSTGSRTQSSPDGGPFGSPPLPEVESMPVGSSN